MKVTNDVNILHFQGNALEDMPKTVSLISNVPLVNNYDIDIISCWTDDEKCILYKQLSKNNIKLINALPNDYDYNQKWHMKFKIGFYIDALEKSNKDIVMLLDGYDVLFTSFDNIIEKFKRTNLRILFNASANNYPKVIIDYIPNRIQLGYYKFFNAGCCIGYREDLLEFYKCALKYMNIENLFNSEQLILRCAFAEFLQIPNKIFFDFKCDIFQTMGCSSIWYENDVLNISSTYTLEEKNEKDARQEYELMFYYNVYLNYLNSLNKN